MKSTYYPSFNSTSEVLMYYGDTRFYSTASPIYTGRPVRYREERPPKCAFCGARASSDERGNCGACGAPREVGDD